MCAENIFVDELSIEPCHKTMTMTFQKGLNYLKGQNGSGKTMLLDYVAGIRNDQKQRISGNENIVCLLYTSPSPRDLSTSRMPSSA